MIDNWENLDPPEDAENKCAYCGEDCHKEFCSNNCKKAYEND